MARSRTKDSLFERYDLLVVAAVIGAHANAGEQGFRQRNVRWLIEFFANWVETSLDPDGLRFQNTQISRFLEKLLHDGYLRRTTRKVHPRYQLTGAGLMYLATKVISRPYFSQKEHFFFLHFFLLNYKPRLTALMRAEEAKFPYALQLELDGLLDADALLERQLYYALRELKKLEKRIQDQIGTAQLVTDLVAEKMSYRAISERIEQRFPFSLYTQKPVSQFLSETAEKMGIWELQVGGLRRNELMWKQTKEMLELHIRQLEELKRSPQVASLRRSRM